MSERRDVDYLSDICEAIQRIREYTSDFTFEQFMRDTKTQDAVVRNLEVIGEGTKKLSPQLRRKHKNIPWKDLAGVRDKLIHHYFGIDFEIVWTIVTSELPGIFPNIQTILRNLSH